MIKLANGNEILFNPKKKCNLKAFRIGIETHFWNRVTCLVCGKKHFIFTFEHWDDYEYGEQWYKKCKCGNAIWID